MECNYQEELSTYTKQYKELCDNLRNLHYSFIDSGIANEKLLGIIIIFF